LAEPMKDIIHKYDVTETRRVREVIRERGRYCLHSEVQYRNISEMNMAYDTLSRTPNAAELSEIQNKFPPLEVETMAELPMNDYPWIAIGECIVRKPFVDHILIPQLEDYVFRWTTKADKTKTKRTGQTTSLKRDKTAKRTDRIHAKNFAYPNEGAKRVHKYKASDIPQL